MLMEELSVIDAPSDAELIGGIVVGLGVGIAFGLIVVAFAC